MRASDTSLGLLARNSFLLARNPAGIVVTPETDTRESLKRGFRRDYA
jgi:hypothetical protein